MRGSYLGQDRYDLQFAIKELASGMKTPTEEEVSLKRRGRYLNGKPRCVQTFRRQSQVSDRSLADDASRQLALTVDVDSDWAGDKRTRKSTLRVVIRHGVNIIKTQVNAMKGISLFSGAKDWGFTCVPIGD